MSTTNAMRTRPRYAGAVDAVTMFIQKTLKAIFGYGHTTGPVSMTSLVSNSGVVATDTTVLVLLDML